MLNFRYCVSIVLFPGLLLASFLVAQSHGAKIDKSCSGRGDDDGAPFGTPLMVQRNQMEFAMHVDEELPEDVEAPSALLSKVDVTPAPKVVARPQQKLPGKSVAGFTSEAVNGIDVSSFTDALNRKYTASVAVGAQLLQSMKHRVAAEEFHKVLRHLGLLELDLIATRASWTMAFFVPLLMVGLIVLLVAMRAWLKDAVASKGDGWWEPKSRPAYGNFRDASSMPQRHPAHASQPPSVMGLIASPGKPRDLTPRKTPQHVSTPPAATPQRPSITPNLSIDQLAQRAHLCWELVVPENTECSLLLPEIMGSRLNPNGVLSVNDVNGMAVLYVAYSIAERPPPGPRDLPGNGKRLILRSALEDIVLASCMDGEPEAAGGLPELTIFNKSEEPFGILRLISHGPRSSYLVSLITGKTISVQRDSQTLTSCITDEDGWLLAYSEGTGERGRSIRISPQVCAGLMTLTMLGIDILDTTMGARSARGSIDHALAPASASRSLMPYEQQSKTASR